jgi:hypothetical protein
MSRTNTNYSQALFEHQDYWKRVAYSTVPANRREIEAYVKEFYRDELKRDSPRCVWIDSPRQRKRAMKGMKSDFDTYKIINAKFHQADAQVEKHAAPRLLGRVREAIELLRDPLHIDWHSWVWRLSGNWDEGVHSKLRASAFVDFFITKLGLFKSLKPWRSALVSCSGIYFCEGTLVLVDTPEILRADDHDPASL